VTIWLPETLSSGAGPAAGGSLGGMLGGVLLGGTDGGSDDGDTTDPVHTVPLSENEDGFGLVPLHEPTKPADVDAPVPSEPFQPRLVAVTRLPDCAQVALQPWPTF
jgi:hypothetical protein